MVGAQTAERDAAFAVVQDCAVADIASRRTAISHIQLPSTMATTHQSREQRLPAPHRTSDRGTAFASRIIGDHALVPLELIPGDIALMLILEQQVRCRLWAAQSPLDTLAALLDADLARRTAKKHRHQHRQGLSECCARCCRAAASKRCSAPRHRGIAIPSSRSQTLHLADTLEFGKLGEDELQSSLDALVGILFDAVASGLHLASGNAEEHRATACLLLQRLLRALAKQRQL